MRKNKKGALIVSVLLLLVGVTSIYVAGTYAKYISTATATGTVDVAQWAIEVNDTDITGAGATSLGTLALTTVNSNFVVNGKVAPQSTAYGVFKIDPTGTEVAVGYKFSLGTITASAGTVPTGLAVEKVEYCTGTTCDPTSATGWTAITAVSGSYDGSISLPSATSAMTAAQTVNVKVTVKWTDDETAGATTEDTVDDANHTSAGVSHPTLSIPVTTTVYQKVS